MRGGKTAPEAGGAGWTARFHPGSTRRGSVTGAPRGYVESVVIASFTSRGRPGLLAELRRGPALSAVENPPVVTAIRLLVLVMVVITVPLLTPGFGTGPRGVTTLVTLVLSVATWGVWHFSARRPHRWLAALAVMGLVGGVLAGTSTTSTAVAIGCVVAASAGRAADGRGIGRGDGRDDRRVPGHGADRRRADRGHPRLRGRVPGHLGVRTDPGGPTCCARSRPSRRSSTSGGRTRPRRRRRRWPSGPGSPGDPRRAGPLAGRGLGEPAGSRGAAGGGAGPGQRAGQGD